MTAFDTDVLSDYLDGDPALSGRVDAVPADEQAVTVVTVEELLRGRLNAIRQAQAGRGGVTLPRAYELFTETLFDSRAFAVLPYTPAADSLFRGWKTLKLRIGTQDLRIAAICIVHGAKLATRNARDYAQVPGLNLEIWP